MFLDSENYLPTLKKLLVEADSVDMAVAFWGEGAEKLLSKLGKKIRIVCNLTSGGTNPEVIEVIKKRPGVEVRHIDRLHAKAIIGKKTAIVGSANMSANGLNLEGAEIEGWQEAGFRIDSLGHLKDIRVWFERQWGKAEPITDEMLTLASKRWENRRRDRIFQGEEGRSLLSLSESELKQRNIVVALWREQRSQEATERLRERITAEGNSVVTKSWDCYEDWFDALSLNQLVIAVYIGERGKISICEPVEIFEIKMHKHREGKQKGEEMSLHYCRTPLAQANPLPRNALKGLDKQIRPIAFELLPKGANGYAMPLHEFINKLRN